LRRRRRAKRLRRSANSSMGFADEARAARL
jgi:hypothetical protein